MLVYIRVYLNTVLRTANDSRANVRICLVSARRDKRVSSNSTKKTAIVSEVDGRKRSVTKSATFNGRVTREVIPYVTPLRPEYPGGTANTALPQLSTCLTRWIVGR